MDRVHTIYSDKRKSGIPLIGDISWGTNFCQFYETEKDLLEILVPYFKAGIESNELCIWITCGPLDAGDAGKALEKALPDFREYVDKGQIEIIPQFAWCDDKGNAGGRGIDSKLDQAILSGFEGLRLAYDVPPEMVGDRILAFDEIDKISRRNVITVFSYPRDKFDAAGLMHTVKNHHFALVRNTDRWELIGSSEAGTIKDALKRTEEKLHSLFSNMSEGFAYHRIVLDAEGNPCDYVFQEINSAFEKLTGLKAEKIIGRKVTDVFPGIEKDPVGWIGRYGRVALTGEPEKFESYSESIGKYFSVSAFSPYKGYFAVTFTDVTERKRSEEALRRSESRWNAAIESFAEGAIIATEDEQVIYWNPAARKMHGFTRPEEGIEPLEKTPATFQLWTPDGSHMLDLDEWPMRRIKRGETVRNLELRVRRQDQGWEKVFSYSGAMVETAGGERLIFLTCHDLTELRKAEEALKTSLSEKEVLLKEIHHRVKNNLQVVSSLLELQAGGVQDDAVRGIFQEVNGRVRAMAMIHEKLYQSVDLANVNFADYAKTLLGHLWKAQGPAASGIELDMDLKPVHLPVNAAVPCGLILNELFSNALKHAFRGRNHGRILVSLCEDAGGKVRLSVCDDGIGLPPQMNWQQSRSLGLRIVKTLVRQLHAQVEVRNDPGARFTIRFER